MKGHLGSRPLRERTKERKVRVKTGGSSRHNVRRDIPEVGSQDSESAYHTHEASDSVADRTSSMELDSNRRSTKGDKFSRKRDKQLDISPRVVVPGCENGASIDSMCFKTRESQESDLPQDSNSEDDKKLKVKNDEVENSKRSSQSISSEDEAENKKSSKGFVDDDVINGVNKKELEKKIRFEGLSVNMECPSTNNGDLNVKTSTIKVLKAELEQSGELTSDKVETSFENISLENSSMTLNGNSDSGCNENVLTNESCASSDSQAVSQSAAGSYQCNETETVDGKAVNVRPETICSSVRFNKESDQLREITPLNSRETSPTHTQSDCLLQNKSKIRGSVCDESDTETESESEHKNNKVLPNRRRKNPTVQESVSCDATSFTLRNRKQPSFPLREPKSNDTTAVSSSEGETEGHSSEYSRGSRRVGR